MNSGFDLPHLIRIDNMIANDPLNDRVALIGYQSGSSSQINNLGMENARSVGQGQVGVITGQTYNSDVADLYTVGHVIGSAGSNGGVHGRLNGSSGSLTRVTSYTNVIGSDTVAGIHSITQGSDMYDSANHGHVMATSTGQAGGINSSCASGAIISASYNTGNIMASAYRNGGLTGNAANCQISDSYATGNLLSSSRYIGGLVGEASAGTMSMVSSYSTSNVAATSYGIGGLIGLNDGDIDDSFSTGIVLSPSTDVGGAIGETTVTTVDNVHYYDHAGNPSATCTDTGSPNSCTANATLTDFHDQSPGAQNAPIDTFDFGTPVWKWDSSLSDFPVLDWQ